jgi:hypothetical protein
MSNLIKIILSGITSITSTESEEKEDKMLNFTTNVPEIDQENTSLFRAAQILETLGNKPGLKADDFYSSLLLSDYPVHDHETITLAAIAIETMMTYDSEEDSYSQSTIH